MAYQLSDIISKTQRRIRDTGYSSTEITDYLNDTQNDVFNEYRFRFMRTSVNYTVAIGVADITNGVGVPTDFQLAIDLIDTAAGQEATITYIELEELERLYDDPQDTTTHPNGAPLYWYWDGNTPKVYPAPNTAYTVKLRYYKKPTLLSADSQVPEVPSEFEELLVRGAASRILEVKDNYDQAAVHKNKYDELLQKMVVRYSTGTSGRPVTMRINRYPIPARTVQRWRY